MVDAGFKESDVFRAQPCDHVFEARYCIKTTGLFGGGWTNITTNVLCGIHTDEILVSLLCRLVLSGILVGLVHGVYHYTFSVQTLFRYGLVSLPMTLFSLYLFLTFFGLTSSIRRSCSQGQGQPNLD